MDLIVQLNHLEKADMLCHLTQNRQEPVGFQSLQMTVNLPVFLRSSQREGE
jgi:hypothetical protein